MKTRCEHCGREPTWIGRGRIEMPNNGPIVECPVCEGTGFRHVVKKEDGE